MITDPIADMLIRIKNGYLAGKKLVEVPFSKIKQSIAQILVKEGYLKNARLEVIDSGKKKQVKKNLILELRYKDGRPALTDVKRVSKPGVRIYLKSKEISKPKFGLGITIVSTSKGIMTHKEAKKRNLGGEIICEVW